MKPQYFDLTVMDVDAARRFFEACLGWQFEQFGPIPGYYRIKAGLSDEPGIDGGIGAAKDFPQSGGRPLTLMTIPVPNIDDVISNVEQHGGRASRRNEPFQGSVGSRPVPSPGGCCSASSNPIRVSHGSAVLSRNPPYLRRWT